MKTQTVTSRLFLYLLSSSTILFHLFQNVHSFAVKTKASLPPIIACKSTSEVKGAISAFVKPNDSVIELGAQLSETSAHLCRIIGSRGKAVLVDVKRKEATSGRSTSRDTTPFIGRLIETRTSKDTKRECFIDRVHYEELEKFDDWRKLTKGNRQYHVMILDVGSMIGNDLYLSALSLSTEFIANQDEAPRAIILKSRTICRLARRIVHSQRLFDGAVGLPDSMVRTHEPTIVPCVGVNEYRKTIPFLVKQGDVVIEVGSHCGTTTALLYDAAMREDSGGFCVGVDIGEKIILSARKKYPHVMFEVIDAWNTLDLLKVKVNCSGSSSSNMLGYDVVYADIGGLSGPYGLLESLALIDAIAKALEPHSIVIKSMCMKRLASQLIPYTRYNMTSKRLVNRSGEASSFEASGFVER